ncbi:EngB/YsxC GTP-binding protein [Candidatus Cyrtobacter comes]|uniref:Probable GTP-binding protein EngB n=1 Tax=Candidatus Cyrtobacter comes TaxID=675776 RepID=A0ABU5L8S4_9RICK|nr:ribosome biogenesis GTP-binding protein YihA/YsxC [Candidatus Cyrtobacter comes]MDZ5762526.1 EngB/YsxC GTP-binding protein [Candidatus Cyrtobacter comes]
MSSNIYFIKSAKSPKDFPNLDIPEFAFIGRSNVGKSSLISKITNNSSLVKTSKTPGQTSAINFFMYGKSVLVDLPGYGYSGSGIKSMHEYSDLILSYILNSKNMLVLFLLIDFRIEPKESDIKMIESLQEVGLNFFITFTKIEKVKENHILEENIFAHVSRDRAIYTSSRSGDGIKKIRNMITSRVL